MAKKKGFSLIELLVVMAIISILATLGIYSYLKYISNARFSKMQTVLENVKLAVEEYYADHDEYPNGTCNFLNYDIELNSCTFGNFRIQIPGHFCVKFQTVDCNGTEGYVIVVTSNILHNSDRNGPAKLVYQNCLSGGGIADIICTDNDIHGRKGTCTTYSCP